MQNRCRLQIAFVGKRVLQVVRLFRKRASVANFSLHFAKRQRGVEGNAFPQRLAIRVPH